MKIKQVVEDKVQENCVKAEDQEIEIAAPGKVDGLDAVKYVTN